MRTATNTTLNLTDNSEMVYYGPLVIGSDSSYMTFDFDTGSDWLWVPLASTSTPSCSNCYTPHHHTIAAPDTSLSQSCDISYMDGSGINGSSYSTTVGFSGTSTVTTMNVCMVT